MTETTVRIPTPLRPFTAGHDEVNVAGATVGQVLQTLGQRYDGLLGRVLDPEGHVRPFVNVYLGSKNVRTLNGLDTRVSDGDVLSILPAVAGGM